MMRGSDKLGYGQPSPDFTNCMKDCDVPVVTRVTSVARLMQGDDFSRFQALGNVDDRSELLNRLVSTGVILTGASFNRQAVI